MRNSSDYHLLLARKNLKKQLHADGNEGSKRKGCFQVHEILYHRQDKPSGLFYRSIIFTDPPLHFGDALPI